MRTTINLDADLVPLVKDYAAKRAISLSGAISNLVRRGLSVRGPRRMRNGLLVVDLPEDSPRVTSEQVKRLESGPRKAQRERRPCLETRAKEARERRAYRAIPDKNEFRALSRITVWPED